MDFIGLVSAFGTLVFCLMLVALVAGPLIVAVVLLNRSARQQAAPARAEAESLLALLQDHLASVGLTDDPGGRQAVADATACLDVATRFAPSGPNAYRWQQVGLLCAHGLDFLRPWRDVVAPEGSAIPPVPAAAAAGRINTVHHGPGDDPLIASPERTDATPYHHPGGGIAGVPVPTGWYSQAWWADALRTGQQTPQLLAGWQALFGPGTEPSTYHSGLGDLTRLTALWGILLSPPPPHHGAAVVAAAAAGGSGASFTGGGSAGVG